MKHVQVRVAVGAALALSIAVAGGAQAQAADLHCQASTLSASGVGFPQAVSPVTAGGSGACANRSATPALPSNPALSADLLASTTYDAKTKTGTATGGLMHLGVVPSPALVAQLPTEQAIAALGPVTTTLMLPLGLLGALVPAQYTLDVQQAVKDAVAVPDALLTADVITAHASVACQAGVPQLSGSSHLAGVDVAGVALPADGVLQQAVTLIGAQHLPLSSLDPNKVQVMSATLDGLPVVGAQLTSLVSTLMSSWSTVTGSVPTLPATTLDVAITPGGQLVEGASLTQHALSVHLGLGGLHVLDADIGEAKVSADAGACALPAPSPTGSKPADQGGVDALTATGSVADQILACSDRRLVLMDVLRQGNLVELLGAANRDYAGKRVAIRLRATGRVVAHATVQPDGSFQTTAPLPPRRFRTPATRDLVRYSAEIGTERSLPLKLQRRMIVSRMSSHGGKVTISGRVVGPLTTPSTTIRLMRRLSCKAQALVKAFKPSPDGRFSVTVDAPEGQVAAVYRMTTFVRANRHSPKRFPTFTLPRGVALDTR